MWKLGGESRRRRQVFCYFFVMHDPVDPPSYGDRQGERRESKDRRRQRDRRHAYPGQGREARRIERLTWAFLIAGIGIGVLTGVACGFLWWHFR